MVKLVKLVAPWLVLAAAVAITGYAWYRTQAVVPTGGVRWIEWRDETGAPLPEPRNRLEGGCERALDSHFESMVFGDQLIIPCRTGYALIDVARGGGTLLSVPEPISRRATYAIVPGPGDQIAFVWDGGPPVGYDIKARLVAIADRRRARWRIPPTEIPEGTVVGAAWVGDAFEIAQYELTKLDHDGGTGNFEILVTRVTNGGIARRMLEPCKYCRTTGIFHGGSRGWVRVINAPLPRTYEQRVNRLVPEHGPAEDLQPGPRIPDDFRSFDTDGIPQGVLSRGGPEVALVLGPDGYLHDRPLPKPGPGLRPLIWQRIRVAGGALERHRVWTDDPPNHWAQMVGGRTLFARSGDRYGEILVGDDRERMRMGTRLCYQLVTGVWMEVGDSLAFVSPDGGCIALFEPRTLEPRIRASLREHLRTDGSRTREVSTPEAERKLAIALFGLVPCLIVAAAVALQRRRPIVPGLAIGAAVYAAVALYVLRDLLPLLS